MHSNVTIKNVSWPHFSWPTLYSQFRFGYQCRRQVRGAVSIERSHLPLWLRDVGSVHDLQEFLLNRRRVFPIRRADLHADIWVLDLHGRRSQAQTLHRQICESLCRLVMSLYLYICLHIDLFNFGRFCLSVCMYVCLSVCQKITFESLDVRSSYLLIGIPPCNTGQVRIQRSFGQGQGNTTEKGPQTGIHTADASVFPLPRTLNFPSPKLGVYSTHSGEV